jgi:hypothetical protein
MQNLAVIVFFIRAFLAMTGKEQVSDVASRSPETCLFIPASTLQIHLLWKGVKVSALRKLIRRLEALPSSSSTS